MSQNCVQDMKESTNVTELRVILEDYLMSTELRVGYEGDYLMSQNFV